MLAGVFVIPAVLAVIVGILSWNARAGFIVGALLLCAEIAVLAFPHHAGPQRCVLSDSCRVLAPPTPVGLSTASGTGLQTGSRLAHP